MQFCCAPLFSVVYTNRVIAFHAYLSQESSGPLPKNHIRQFHFVLLNRGNGWNAIDRTFTVPSFVTCVFTWSLMCDVFGKFWTQWEMLKLLVLDFPTHLLHQFGISLRECKPRWPLVYRPRRNLVKCKVSKQVNLPSLVGFFIKKQYSISGGYNCYWIYIGSFRICVDIWYLSNELCDFYPCALG